MTVLITLTTAGTDSGPFTLYSNIDGYGTPFATGSYVLINTINVVTDPGLCS